MNSIKDFALGLLASLLYAAGFANAASHIDSTIQGDVGPAAGLLLVSVEPCAGPCNIAPEGAR